MTVAQYVHKKDFSVNLALPCLDGETDTDVAQLVSDLVDAVHTVRPSFLNSRLVLEFRQPTRGLLANAILRMCQHGIPSMQIDMLFPNRPELAADAATHLVVYRYGVGHVVAQETLMGRVDVVGEEIMLHRVVASFKEFVVDTREWAEGDNRPKLVVDNSGVQAVADV